MLFLFQLSNHISGKVSTNTVLHRSCFVAARLSVPVPCKVVLLLRIVQVEEGVALPGRNKLQKNFGEIVEIDILYSIINA